MPQQRLAALAGFCIAFFPLLAATAGETRIVGWRGDGTGKYPAADPPTTWRRVSTTVEGLRFAARPPAGEGQGTAMPDGVIRQWLVLGPVPFAEGAAIEKDTVPGEAELAPDEGRKTADATWKRVSLNTAYLDFATLVGKPGDTVAYACSHVYTPADATFRMNLTYVGGIRVCVNGKAAKPMGTRFKLDLTKGWNRILLKVSHGSSEATGVADWYVVPVLHAWAPAKYQDTNIAWTAPLPAVHPGFYGGGQGVGTPVIVGDRMFVESEPHDLICLRKADGKVLWIRRSSAFEAASAEEKELPAFKEAAEIAAKIDAINAAFVAGTASREQLDEEKARLEKDLQKKMRRVDADKYTPGLIPDIGYSGFTASSDGRFVYAWFGSGVTACYDMDGNRRWIRVDPRPAVEHGFSSSPLLVEDKYVTFSRDLLAFDAATGKLAWQLPLVSHEGLNPGGFFHGSPVAATIGPGAKSGAEGNNAESSVKGDSPIFAETKIGTVPARVIVLGNGTIVRASDGKVLYTDPDTGNQAVASPVVEQGRIFRTPSSRSALVVQTLPETLADPLKLPTRQIAVDLSAFPKHYLPWHLSSPVIHQGLAYLMNNAGVLTVVDVDAGKVVYQKLLDLDPFQAANEGAARGQGASLAMAGKHLYFLGNNGAALVLEPGRTYREVAKNKIENVVMARHWAERQERFMASPVFDGSRLYLRGEGAVYAIGER